MRNHTSVNGKTLAVALAGLVLVSGCLVGPNYKSPPAPVAESYRPPATQAVTSGTAASVAWWTVFKDPVLNDLVQMAYRQNPTLKSAAVRVLEAQARRGIAAGLMLPQQQFGYGGYTRSQLSENRPNFNRNSDRSYDSWQLGAAAAWELDIWGRFRRGIESADAEVLATIANYDDVLVTLIADVAVEYVTIRTLQEQRAVALANVEIQRRGLEQADFRFKGGTATELDRVQATSLLRNTEALIPEFETAITQHQNTLCELLGLPPRDLMTLLGAARGIPGAPASVALGIPADLLRRRPDIRRAERELAAQSARIGIAQADLYPTFALAGDIRLTSENFADLFQGSSVQAFGGPSFRWSLFNYGRIENNVRVQDARFQALIGHYEQVVLHAQAEVENAVAGYLGAQQETVLLTDSAAAARRAVEISETQYKGGIADYTRVLLSQTFLQDEQNRLVSRRGAVALNLVSLYRALGGGWELRGDQVQLDEHIQAQMRQRTNWGDMLPATKPRQEGGPATQPARS